MARVMRVVQRLLTDGPRLRAERQGGPAAAGHAPGDAWWGLDPTQWRNLLVLTACAAAMAVHQSFRWDWFIDDAAICFAYARNLVEGYGLVPYPGAERVEGYSDPLWILILSVFQAVGLDGFTVAKPLGLLFALGTSWATWRLGERAMPDHAERGHFGPLLAPAVLACSSQFAIWSASGLENGLFCLVLAFAMWRTLEEIDELNSDSPPPPAAGWRARLPTPFPWSAGLYFLLAMTRPEGVLYAAAAGAVLGVSTLRRHGARPLLYWGLALAVPLALQEVARLWYFAWALPNTFYAKITSRGTAPLDWDGRGWLQLRNWADRLWQGYFSPLYVIGLAGGFGRRTTVALGVLGALTLSLLWPGFGPLNALGVWPELPPPPAALVTLRMGAFLLFGAALPALAFWTRGGTARVLCGYSVVAGLAFHLYATGDWMTAFRFLSFIAAPLSVLFAAGLTAVADEVERRFSGGQHWAQAGWVAALLGLGLQVPPNVWSTRDHILFSLDETTAAVKLRADYTRSIVRRTFWEEPVVNFENDQGAHLWWNPDYRQLDMAMLIDIPMSRHWFQQRDFVKEYLFRENPLTFAQIRFWWVGHTGLTKYSEFQKTMFRLPGYQSLPRWGFFDHCFARRSMVMTDKWTQSESRRVKFDWDIVLEGFEQPAPWARGGQGYLEAPFSVTAKREPGSDVQVVAFLSTGGKVVTSWTLPMGYGFYPMDWWKVGQIFRGRHAVAVPRSLQPGKYDLGFVITGPKGRVLPALEVPPGAVITDPVFAVGEVRFPKAITVLEYEGVTERMNAVRAEFQRQVKALSCEQAERSWVRFKRHRPEDWAFHDQQKPAFAAPLAGCWAARAAKDPDKAVDWLAKAHRWDPKSQALATVGAPIGDRLLTEGKQALAAQDWETAYDRFSELLRFQPWRAWARRWAEEARDHRLGLTDDVRIGVGGEDNLRAWEAKHGGGAKDKK
jgi:hypothetical protein